MEHRLPLSSAALEIARLAVLPNGRHVALDCAPASNLPPIVGASPAQ
jgi:hypothetical protein